MNTTDKIYISPFCLCFTCVYFSLMAILNHLYFTLFHTPSHKNSMNSTKFQTGNFSCFICLHSNPKKNFRLLMWTALSICSKKVTICKLQLSNCIENHILPNIGIYVPFTRKFYLFIFPLVLSSVLFGFSVVRFRGHSDFFVRFIGNLQIRHRTQKKRTTNFWFVVSPYPRSNTPRVSVDAGNDPHWFTPVQPTASASYPILSIDLASTLTLTQMLGVARA